MKQCKVKDDVLEEQAKIAVLELKAHVTGMRKECRGLIRQNNARTARGAG